MKNNTLVVDFGDKNFKAIYVNYDNYYEEFCKIVDGSGISTIHTRETQDISQKLGFHIMGFIDKAGDLKERINNYTAAEISGYPYIHSKMVLCLTDNKFNALPFNEKQLNALMRYLKDGVVESIVDSDELQDFIDKYGINPLTINCPGVESVIEYRNDEEQLIIFKYEIPMDDEIMNSFGGAMFNFSNTLLTKFIEESCGWRIDKNHKYRIKGKMDMASFSFYIAIQVLNDKHPNPPFEEILDFIH